MIKGEYFASELAPGLFLIGCDEENPWGRTGKEIKPQTATGNSYLVVGEEKALLVDSNAQTEGLRAFVESLVSVPVMLALSHGHFDHTYRLQEFDEFWIHPADEKVLQGGNGMPECEKVPSVVHYLRQGDVIELGDRTVDVYEMQGHTDGSLLFLDRASRTLISGDSIARRLLYGTCKWVPVTDYIKELEDMKKLDFDNLLSAHDRIFLPKSHIDHMISGIKKIPQTERRIQLGIVEGDFIQVVDGEENQVEFIDMCFPESHLEDMIQDLQLFYGNC